MHTLFTSLKPGDIRQPGDEVVHKGKRPSGLHSYTGEEADYDWHRCQLIGHPILQSDVIVAEFRRPIR